MFIAKVTTRYPEFKGAGYYNFLMNEDEDDLTAMVDEVAHDFKYEGTRFTDMELDDILEKYPTKGELNKGLFGDA